MKEKGSPYLTNYPLFPLILLRVTMFHFVANADLELVIFLSLGDSIVWMISFYY